MLGKPVLRRAEEAVVLHDVHGDVDGDGEDDEFGQAAAETLPCLGCGAFEGDLFLRQAAFEALFPLQGRQQGVAKADGEERAQGGRPEGEPGIYEGGRAEHGPEHEKHGGQVHHIGGEAVEEVGEHQFAQAGFPLGVAFGKQSIGGGGREKGH